MSRRLLTQLVAGSAALAWVAILGPLTAGMAAAAPPAPPPTNQAILNAISGVQSTANTINTKVDAIEGKLDSGPTKLTACTTMAASGAYVLTTSLTAVGTCLVVAADFVTLDLDGQTLQGNGSGSGVTDGGVARKGTVVRNGAVTAFGTGIDLAASTGSVVERVRAVGNSSRGITAAGEGNTFIGNTATNNGGDGILGGAGTFTGNTAIGNDSDGIVGGVGTFSGNTANNNGGNGIHVSDGSTVTGNTVNNNGGPGIAGGFHMTISNNTATSNTGIGINISACAAGNASNLIGNTAQNNTGGNTSSLTNCVTANNSF